MVCDTDTNKRKEMIYIKNTFKKNGYPEEVISRSLKTRPWQ